MKLFQEHLLVIQNYVYSYISTDKYSLNGLA